MFPVATGTVFLRLCLCPLGGSLYLSDMYRMVELNALPSIGSQPSLLHGPFLSHAHISPVVQHQTNKAHHTPGQHHLQRLLWLPPSLCCPDRDLGWEPGFHLYLDGTSSPVLPPTPEASSSGSGCGRRGLRPSVTSSGGRFLGQEEARLQVEGRLLGS